MITAAAIITIWLGIGAAFGWRRAKERYLDYLDEFPTLRDNGDRQHRLDAMAVAAWTLFLWSLMGIFAGVAFAVWYFMAVYARERRRR